MKTYNSNEQHIVTDNVECLRLLVDRGALEQLKPCPGANSAFHSYTTDHHYCLASYHTEHGNNEDDGYLIVMVPKTTWTFERAAQFFADAIVESTERISYEYKKIPEKQNN